MEWLLKKFKEGYLLLGIHERINKKGFLAYYNERHEKGYRVDKKTFKNRYVFGNKKPL